MSRIRPLFLLVFASILLQISAQEPLVVFWWKERWRGRDFVNFGDHLAQLLVERIVEQPVEVNNKRPLPKKKRLFAIGSVLSFAQDGDVVWGSGINGRLQNKKHYRFSTLDVRAVRGPLSRQFLMDHFQIMCPEIYGDPGLLFPRFFPEFKKSPNPSYEYLIIPHYADEHLFPKTEYPNVVYPTESWDVVISKILDSKFVIASSLHGVIIAEAYGIPARLLRLSEEESPFKFQDYYLGTGRPHFRVAHSIEEALYMGGEIPFHCDLEKLLKAFPFEFWEDS
jgi:pyruvyltransferase